MKVVSVPIGELQGAPYNPRKMPDAEMAKLMRGLEQYGLVQPIIVNKRSGLIVGGHQRVEAAKRLGWPKVDVLYVDLDDQQEKALNLSLNRISGEWDSERLANLLSELNDAGSLELTGFGREELDELLESVGGDGGAGGGLQGDPDEVPEPPAEPITKPGDIIILGKHRLLCGDSTKAEDVQRLMGGAKADMVFTDPPYNVAYEGGTKDKLTIQNDEMGDADFFAFLLAVYRNLLASTKPGGAIYVCHADSEGANFRKAMKDAGWLLKQCLIWVKSSLVLGRQDYHWRHEPILYGWAPGAAHYFVDDRTQDAIWEFPKPARNGEHPTMKPVALVERAVCNSSKPGGLVLDLFGGSGSTLMACEAQGRRAALMELDPKYVDVIVNRWQQATGKQAVRP